MAIPKMLIIVPVLTFAFSCAVAGSGGAAGAAILTDGFNNWTNLWSDIFDGTGKGIQWMSELNA